MSYQDMKAHSKSIKKWANIISKEVGIDIEKVKGESPTYIMSYIIGQLKRNKNQSREEQEKVSRKLRKKWKKEWKKEKRDWQRRNPRR